MSDLVSVQQFKDFLGVTDVAELANVTSVLDGVEATFIDECGRTLVPFADTQAGRVEKQKGTGSDVLFLDYPIAVLTSVKLGFDSAVPDETLAVADQTELVWSVGSRLLTRVDGGRFGRFAAPAYVTVTYDTAADLPADAAPAILREAARIYRQRGAEDASSETIGGQTATLLRESDDVWQAAVGRHLRVPL